jgi:hypothetical protein
LYKSTQENCILQNTMKTTSLACLILLSSFAFGATPSNASLKGTYAFNYQNAETNTRYAVVSCVNFKGLLPAGSVTHTPVQDGTIVFDGKGKATFTGTQYGHFNQALSNATVVWGCDANGNPVITNFGSAVYDAPVAFAGTGTYSIQTNYTGAMTITSGGVASGFVLRLAATNATTAFASQVLFHGLNTDNSSEGSGTGVKQ